MKPRPNLDICHENNSLKITKNYYVLKTSESFKRTFNNVVLFFLPQGSRQVRQERWSRQRARNSPGRQPGRWWGGQRQEQETPHQEAPERLHAVHEGDACQGGRRVHAQRECRHQPNSRQTGKSKNLFLYISKF